MSLYNRRAELGRRLVADGKALPGPLTGFPEDQSSPLSDAPARGEPVAVPGPVTTTPSRDGHPNPLLEADRQARLSGEAASSGPGAGCVSVPCDSSRWGDPGR